MPRSVFSSGLVAAGLGAAAEQERRERKAIQQQQQQQQQTSRGAVNILGQGKIWVRVENLAPGTTAEDVQVSISASYQVIMKEPSSVGGSHHRAWGEGDPS